MEKYLNKGLLDIEGQLNYLQDNGAIRFKRIMEGNCLSCFDITIKNPTVYQDLNEKVREYLKEKGRKDVAKKFELKELEKVAEQMQVNEIEESFNKM